MTSRVDSFWDFYRARKEEDKNDPIVLEVKKDFITQGKYERKALNSPTQGTGIIILKKSMTKYFRWIVDNGYFGIVLLCNLIHDEAVSEYPKTMTEVPEIMKNFMEETAAEYCKALPIPAEYNIAEHWVH